MDRTAVLEWLARQDPDVGLRPGDSPEAAVYELVLADETYHVPLSVAQQGLPVTRTWLEDAVMQRWKNKAESLELAAAAMRLAISGGVHFNEV